MNNLKSVSNVLPNTFYLILGCAQPDKNIWVSPDTSLHSDHRCPEDSEGEADAVQSEETVRGVWYPV